MAHGGFRPGSGRKGNGTERYQTRMRKVVEKAISVADWQAVVLKAKDQATNGDRFAREWLTPWILGAPPKPVERNDADASRVVSGDLP